MEVMYGSPYRYFVIVLFLLTYYIYFQTQNLKASPHSPIQQIQSPVADEYSLLNRLPECSEEDIHLALELSLHYLISNVLMFIYFNRINSRQQVLFIRDLSSELVSCLYL